MVDHFMNHAVETTISIIFGVFIINMLCENFLGFRPLDVIKSLINKIIGNKDED